MRLDKIHWVDLNGKKKQEYTFTPLNESAKHTKKSEEKIRFLEWTLYDFVIKKYGKIFTEAV